MAGITRTVHPSSNIRWASLAELCPDIGVKLVSPDGQEAEGESPMGLAFVDPDGEMHVYPMTPDGKQNLMAQLTGGVIVPDGRNQPVL